MTIDNTPAPTPYKYKIIRADLDSDETYRDADFVLLRNRVREGVYKLEQVWRLSMTELETLTGLLKPAKIVVNFFDATTGDFITKDMYAGDRTSELLSPLDENDPDSSLWEFSCNFVEY